MKLNFAFHLNTLFIIENGEIFFIVLIVINKVLSRPASFTFQTKMAKLVHVEFKEIVEKLSIGLE